MRIVTSLALATALSLALSSGAQAAEISPGLLRRVLPEVEHVRLPRVTGIDFAVIATTKYGTGVPAEERALKGVADDAASKIYAVRDEGNLTEGSFEAWRQCFEGMFKDAATRYRNAALDQLLGDSETGYPSWSADIEAGAVTCLNQRFGESQATHDVARIMGNQLGAWAADASGTSSAAAVLANWFDKTGDELEHEPLSDTTTTTTTGVLDPSTSPPSGGGGGSSSTGWIIGAVIAAAAAGVALFLRSQKKGTP